MVRPLPGCSLVEVASSAALAKRESRKLANTFTTYEDVGPSDHVVEATFGGRKAVRAWAQQI